MGEPKEEEPKKEEAEVKEESKEDLNAETKCEEAEAKETAEVEAPKMVEETDAAEDKRKKVAEADVVWSPAHATCNAMVSMDGKMLMTLCGSGFQYLLAGVRCSAGVKAGRYMFEAKIVESLNPSEGQQRIQARTPMPRQLLRLGVSTDPNSSLLDESADKVYFDCEGFFMSGRRRNRASAQIGREQVAAVLINTDASSPNANTISLFRDGHRVSDPQPLPESMVGKVLYPCLTWKNFNVQVNLGPKPLKALPFTCRMLADAAAADLEVTKPVASSKNEVLFPVGLPDQGLFDWLDGYLEKNPHFVELSDRKVLEWAKQSGISTARAQYARGASADKPGMDFGIPFLDDGNVQQTLSVVAPVLKKDFVRMELKSNLVAAERKAALAKFPSSRFKKVAVVAMGEPPADFKAKVHEWMLADKTERVTRERAMAARDAKRRKTEVEPEPPKSQDEEQAPEAEPEKKEGEEAEAPKEGEEKDGEKEKSEEAEPPKEQKPEEVKPTEEEEDKPIELTEEEKNVFYYKRETPDISQAVLAKTFASFSLPSKDEGFDEIRFAWSSEEKCAAHIKAWLLNLKKTQKAEDLEPSAWFKEKSAEWTKALSDWKRRQNDTRDVKPKPAASKVDDKKDDAEEKPEEAAGEDAEKKDEEMVDGDGDKKDDEEKKAEEEDKAVDEEPDVNTVADINDVGTGKPLFSRFEYEDWVLLALRFEFHLLVHAFKKDLDDPDRPGFTEAHLNFYYHKYYKKEFNLRLYKMKEFSEMVALLKDTISIDSETGFLQASLPEEEAMDKFVRLTEENRRERQLCIDAGDETANLKFDRPSVFGSRDKGGYPSIRGSAGGARYGDRGGYGDRGDRGGYKGGSARGSYPPPSRDSRGGGYGMPPQGMKRGPAPGPAYASKQPRYGSAGGGPSRSSYPPPSDRRPGYR